MQVTLEPHQVEARIAREIAQEYLLNLLIEWRRELWPDLNDDPIFRENLERGVRDWRSVDLTPYSHKRDIF